MSVWTDYSGSPRDNRAGGVESDGAAGLSRSGAEGKRHDGLAVVREEPAGAPASILRENPTPPKRRADAVAGLSPSN